MIKRVSLLWSYLSLLFVVAIFCAAEVFAHDGDHQQSFCREEDYYEDHEILCPTGNPFDPFNAPSPVTGSGGGGANGGGGGGGWLGVIGDVLGGIF